MCENTKEKARSIQMVTGSLWKNIFLFSIPLMCSQLLEVVFNLSDVAVVGRFADYKALGAVGSTTLLVAVVKGKDVTKESINAAMKAATSESFGYNEDQIVSSDVIGMRYGSLFDATQTMVAKIDDDTYQVQVVSWYDNENSYTSQMVRTIKYFAENC